LLLIKKENETTEIPFTELDAYYYTAPTGTLHLTAYVMVLAHRYSDNFFSFGGDSHFYTTMGKLSYLIRFMDTSKPLPNLPLLALDRNKDPISAQTKDTSNLNLKEWKELTNDEWLDQMIESGDKLREVYDSL